MSASQCDDRRGQEHVAPSYSPPVPREKKAAQPAGRNATRGTTRAKPKPKRPNAMTTRSEARAPFAIGRYGVVRVLAGRYVGRVGYYDDENDEGDAAVVYFGDPFKSRYYEIPFENLEHVDVKHIGLERFRRDHPQLAAHLGLPER